MTTSEINPHLPHLMALDCNYPYEDLLEEIVNDIRFGANIGVSNEYRVVSNSTNAPSALEIGDRVSDSMQDDARRRPGENILIMLSNLLKFKRIAKLLTDDLQP